MDKKAKSGDLILPTGVSINGKKLMITFVYKGTRCRETLVNLTISKPNIKLAERKRSRILDEIANNEFNYAFHFPESKNLNKFRIIKQELVFGNLLRNQIESYERQYKAGSKSIATYHSYRHIIESHLLPAFGRYDIHSVSASLVRNWLIGLNLTSKRISVILTPLRLVFDDAVNREIIDENPLNKIAIKALLSERSKSDYQINPFNEEEKSAILDAADGTVKNFIQFGFWTGMRLSEIIALRWANVDFEAGVIHVTEAKVLGTTKTPKTKSGIRKVIMLPLAREALLAQFEISKNSQFVFTHPTTEKQYANNNAFRRLWLATLAKAKVKYRNPHQMRHTYASTLLLRGNKPLLVAQQLGHKNLQMLLQVYGKYIQEKDEQILL